MAGDRQVSLDRRKLLGIGAAIGTIAAADAVATHDGMLGGPRETIRDTLPWRDGQTDAPDAEAAPRFLNAVESDFLSAAIDRIIPADDTGPSASQAGVLTFLDRQLGGAYGQGEHFYLEGPWAKGAPTQGYQSRFTPAQFYRHAIPAIERAVGKAHDGKAFKDLDPGAQDALLKQMESGDLKIDGPITSEDFFTMFLQNVLEGYFSDPIYGGNRNGSAWAMIGFPGAHYDYTPWVKAYGQRVPVQPVGLRGRADWSRG